MNERPRHREVLGVTASVCPHCGGGPMVVTRSWRSRRLRDVAVLHFDPDVVHRHVCTACSARFPIGVERVRAVLVPTPATGHDEPTHDPQDDLPDDEVPETPAADDAPAPPSVGPGLPAARVQLPPARTAPLARAAPIAPPRTRLVSRGRPVPLGAGRRSGPVRLPVSDRTG